MVKPNSELTVHLKCAKVDTSLSITCSHATAPGKIGPMFSMPPIARWLGRWGCAVCKALSTEFHH